MPLRLSLALLFVTLLAPPAAMAGPAADRSLPAHQYIDRGAPPQDRAWSGDDYASASGILKQIAREDPSLLPRYKSARSGQYFDRLVSLDNLEPLHAADLPPEAKMAYGVNLFEGPKELLVLYMESGKPAAAFDSEVCELLAYQLRLIVVLLDPIEQFLTTTEMTNPKARLRAQAVGQMREGLASILDAALLVMGDPTTYRADGRRRLTATLEATMPKIAPELPGNFRGTLNHRLSRLTTQESDASIRRGLQKMTADVGKMPPSRLDAAVAMIERQAPPAAPERIVWSWHTSRRGGFRGEFPGEPTTQSREGKGRDGKTMSAINLSVRTDAGASFTLLRVNGDLQLPDLAAIDRLLESTYSTAKVVSRSDFMLDSHRGRQVLLRTDRSLLLVRAIPMPGGLLQATVETPTTRPDNTIPADAKRFVESLQLLEY